MNPQPIFGGGRLFPATSPAKAASRERADTFSTILDAARTADRAAIAAYQTSQTTAGATGALPGPAPRLPDHFPSLPSRKELAAAYVQQSGRAEDPAVQSGWQKYKDDQLLRNPGGDRYYLDRNMVSADSRERDSFVSRIGKDLSDVLGNVKNFFGNLFMGSKIRYRDENNQIREATQRGLVGTCVDFFKDLGSALTFGAWHPDEATGPRGVVGRLSHFCAKLKKAFLGDLVEGVPKSVNHMAKNLALAGMNLVQVVPDATIGNLEGGRKITTTLFDNGQVLVEYLTDVIPSGDAWFRVHAMNFSGGKAPVFYNLEMPEHAKADTRWQYVRNTPFRKTIETIGTLLADIATVGLAGQSGISTNQHSEKHKALNSFLSTTQR